MKPLAKKALSAKKPPVCAQIHEAINGPKCIRGIWYDSYMRHMGHNVGCCLTVLRHMHLAMTTLLVLGPILHQHVRSRPRKRTTAAAQKERGAQGLSFNADLQTSAICGNGSRDTQSPWFLFHHARVLKEKKTKKLRLHHSDLCLPKWMEKRSA